jgi:hypothetical protein
MGRQSLLPRNQGPVARSLLQLDFPVEEDATQFLERISPTGAALPRIVFEVVPHADWKPSQAEIRVVDSLLEEAIQQVFVAEHVLKQPFLIMVASTRVVALGATQ